MSSEAAFEEIYVLDTVTFIRYLTSDRKLGNRAKAVIQAAEQGETQLILSAISLAELYYWNGKSKNHVLGDFNEFYQDLTSKPYIRFIPFEPDDILDFVYDEAVPEMHDRIIAGLARRLRAPLITNDPEIIASDTVKTEW